MTKQQSPFREGEVYFRITFPDAGLLYPRVESFVYIGMNLSEDDDKDTWYFQFADSYANFGSVRENKGGDRRVVYVTHNDLVDMLSLADLNRELREAAVRRQQRLNDSSPSNPRRTDRDPPSA